MPTESHCRLGAERTQADDGAGAQVRGPTPDVYAQVTHVLAAREITHLAANGRSRVWGDLPGAVRSTASA